MPRLRSKRPKAVRLLSVRNRLFFGTAGMLLPLLIAFVVSLSAFNSLLDYVDELVYESSQELLPVVELQADVQKIITILRDRSAPLDEFIDLETHISSVDRKFALLETREFGHIEEVEAIGRAALTWELMREAVQSIPYLKQQNVADELELLNDALNDIQTELDVISYVVGEEMDAVLEQAGQTRDRAGVQIGLTLLLALVMASIFGHILAQSILRPLARLRHGVEHFGRGDFKHRIVIDSHDELGRVAYAFNRMAVRLDRSLRSLRRLSTRDYLTNLFNAREFYRILDAELERAERYDETFSLLLIDADHFKQVNDCFGHQSGDKVLRELAKSIRLQVRNVDVPARVGGEEFAVVLPNTSGEAALSIAERVRKGIEAREISLGNEEKSLLKVTVSIGLATFPRSAKDARELFRQADMALYNAKQAQRAQPRQYRLMKGR